MYQDFEGFCEMIKRPEMALKEMRERESRLFGQMEVERSRGNQAGFVVAYDAWIAAVNRRLEVERRAARPSK